MPEVHAKIIDASPQTRSAALHNMQRDNMQGVQFIDFTQDANLQRPADYHVYLFNIAPRRFEVRRPPSWPLITFPACPADKSYVMVGRVPNVVQEITMVVDRTVVNGIRGERFATDLLNPSNLGIDPWAEVTDEQVAWIDGGTDDLTRRGMFWSLNETPEPQELAMAKSRMERHYRSLLKHGDELFRANRHREIGMEHHLAADYFHYRAQWHFVAEAPNFCPNCGEDVKPGIAFHMNNGVLCVIDWQRAVAAGAKRIDEVPEEHRWKGWKAS
jgi:hypothetical protein